MHRINLINNYNTYFINACSNQTVQFTNTIIGLITNVQHIAL